MDDFLTFDLDNDPLLEDEETSFEEFDEMDSEEWEDKIISMKNLTWI